MEESPKSRKEANIFLVTTNAWVQMVGRIKRPKSTLKMQLTIKAAKYQTRKHMNKDNKKRQKTYENRSLVLQANIKSLDDKNMKKKHRRDLNKGN